MKRELPAGAEKRCFVGSSFCFSDFEKLLLTTNTPIGIQGGNSVKKLEEFLEYRLPVSIGELSGFFKKDSSSNSRCMIMHQLLDDHLPSVR